jgi:polysaccharide biosynthesis/export protein
MLVAATLTAVALLARPAAAQNQPGVQPTGPVSAAPAAGVYVLEVGDELSIKVFGRPELDDTVTIRRDGRLSSPLVDDQQAAGLTTTQLGAALTERYTKLFLNPQVSVILRKAANMKVFVGGEVGQPGVLTINGVLTTLGAVYQAGGFRRSARTDSVMLLRDVPGQKPSARRLDLKDFDKGDAAVALEPNDVLFVPQSRIAKADNFVDEYIRQLIPISMTAGFSYLIGTSVIGVNK